MHLHGDIIAGEQMLASKSAFVEPVPVCSSNSNV